MSFLRSFSVENLLVVSAFFLHPHHHYLLEGFLARFKTVLSYKVGLFFDL